MASEPDLSALLPPPPPPRPDRREAAIGAALRQFDGEPPAARATPHRWRFASRPQLGAIAAAALVAAIGLPLWLSGEHQTPGPAQIAATPVRPAQAAADTVADLAAAPMPEAIVSQAPGIVAQAARQVTVAPVAEPVLRDAPATTFAAAPPPALVAPAPPPPPPPAAPAMAAQEATADNDIVVTGSRVSGRTEKARSRAEQRAVAQENLAGAVAFDRADASLPQDAAGWLDRGLAHAKVGDDKRALADLDKGVRRNPDDARLRYERSLILRRLGHSKRADADAARAAELDPRYRERSE